MIDHDHSEACVVMSTYNPNPKYFNDQMTSILNQTYPVDILIRDDGSSSKTSINAIRQYLNHKQIRIVWGENRGFVDSFFKALLLAGSNYKYYFFCDQDDCWMPNRVQSALTYFKSAEQSNPSKPILCYSHYVFCNSNLMPIENQKIVFTPSFQNALSEIPIPGMSMGVNAGLRNLMLETDSTDMPGHDWWAYLLATAFGEVIEDPNVNLYYRRHESNVSNYSSSFLGQTLYRIKTFIFGNYLQPVKSMINTFSRLYSNDSRLSPRDKALLNLYLPGHHLSKTIKRCLYPKRFRASIFEEIGYRFIILIGKL